MVASTSPERVPMGKPARGPRPMEVSMHLPSTQADREEPLPRWQQITRLCSGLPSMSMARAET